MGRMAELDADTEGEFDMVAYLESELQDACDLLSEAHDNGLIYWEPKTERGEAKKADMMARIDRWLMAHGRGL